MAEQTRDVFPPSTMARIHNPQKAMSNLAVSRQRPNGLILQPVAQQQDDPTKGRQWRRKK